MTGSFIHLRVRSAYSLSEGAIAPKALVKRCRRENMPAVAVTDTNNLFGALEFAMAAKETGIQPVLGLTLSITSPEQGARALHRPAVDELALLAKDKAGYQNLMALSSRAFLDSDPAQEPQVPLSLLAEHQAGLLCLTGGGKGRLARLLSAGQKDAAAAFLQELRAIFKDRLYLELQRHEGGSDAEIERRSEAGLLDFAYSEKIPLLATNDVHFLEEDFYEAHDALLCIAAGRVIGETDRRRLSPDYRFKSADEMQELFADLPEAIANTAIVAERCAFMPLPSKKSLLPPFHDEEGANEEILIRREAEKGLAARLRALGHSEPPPAYRERLSFELDVIVKMGFAGYFLIVSDFIRWAKAEDIPVGPGRGSGAGSVVAWALAITDLDPLRLGLLFERFLNPERVSMPDFDVDFCQDRRDEVIDYVQRKYGIDRVAAIITFGKLKARAALRDTGRVLQMPYGQVDRICKLVPDNPARPVTLQEAIDGEPLLQAMRDQDPQVEKLLEIALRLEGLYRHASTHAAGLVIGDRPLTELVPLYRDPNSTLPATQFDMKMVEKAGLVKFDFLGLKTLSVLRQTLQMLAAKGVQLDLTTLPLDDEKTYAMMAKGDTVGVFQLESAGMRDTLRQMKPNRFEDIIALVALYRPGPMANIPRYCAIKHGKESAEYPHPLLEPVLKETYGIPVYQEQVMQMAQVLAGYSLGTADLLRRAMGKKIKEEMASQRAIFIQGAKEKNAIPQDQAESIFAMMEAFADYGFNKSHAAAYALIAYQTGWLKANHPVEFMAASMNYELNDTDRLNIFRQEVLRLGIPLLPPDINRSSVLFAPEATDENLGIRYALAALKGVGATAVAPVVEERERGGVFEDLFDFARRLDSKALNRKQFESLVAAGAFDNLNRNRAQVLSASEIILRTASSAADERATGQSSLFGGAEPGARPQMPAIPPWDELTRLEKEFAAIGFYLSAHPLDIYKKTLERLGTRRSVDLKRNASRIANTRVKLAGVVIGKTERTSRQGNRFAFLQLSDPAGMFEVTVFSEQLAQCREWLEAGKALLIEADVQLMGEDVRLTAQKITRLEDIMAKTEDQVVLGLDQPEVVASLAEKIHKLPKGKNRITLLVEYQSGIEAEIALNGTYQLSAGDRASLAGMPGVTLLG